MKKFLPYILILIILVGFFSPASSVQAQAEKGQTCTTASDPNNGCSGICARYVNNVAQGGGTIGPLSSCKDIPDKNVKAYFFKM